MLDELEKVNWELLGVGNMPELLRGLGSSDRAIRMHAQNELGYGGSWKAMPALLPFLIELLKLPDIRDKDFILLLISAAGKFPCPDAQSDFPGNSIPLELVNETRTAFLNGMSVYLDCLCSEDRLVRATAANVLSLTKNKAVIPSLLSCVKIEQDEKVCAAIIKAFADLNAGDEIVNAIHHYLRLELVALEPSVQTATNYRTYHQAEEARNFAFATKILIEAATDLNIPLSAAKKANLLLVEFGSSIYWSAIDQWLHKILRSPNNYKYNYTVLLMEHIFSIQANGLSAQTIWRFRLSALRKIVEIPEVWKEGKLKYSFAGSGAGIDLPIDPKSILSSAGFPSDQSKLIEFLDAKEGELNYSLAGNSSMFQDYSADPDADKPF